MHICTSLVLLYDLLQDLLRPVKRVPTVYFQVIIRMFPMHIDKSPDQHRLVLKVHQSSGLHHRLRSLYWFRHPDILGIDGI